jgi:hypothetical protein
MQNVFLGDNSSAGLRAANRGVMPENAFQFNVAAAISGAALLYRRRSGPTRLHYALVSERK